MSCYGRYDMCDGYCDNCPMNLNGTPYADDNPDAEYDPSYFADLSVYEPTNQGKRKS